MENNENNEHTTTEHHTGTGKLFITCTCGWATSATDPTDERVYAQARQHVLYA